MDKEELEQQRKTIESINNTIKKIAKKYNLETGKIPSFSKILSIIVPDFDRISVGYKKTNFGYSLSFQHGARVVKEKIPFKELEIYLDDHISTILEQIKRRSACLKEIKRDYDK